MKPLGKLEEIRDLREIWPHEALDFTPWLAEEENLNLLADELGLDITLEETESGVGDFHVDIFAAETGTDRKIIIENQLEDTNHDHLGKLITYAAGKSAQIIVWVVKRAREEHRAAMEWLNRHTDENIGFFLVEIKLYRIGNSDTAVKFEVVEKPNDWAKDIKRQISASPIHQERFDYWTAFNDYAFQDPAFSRVFKKRKPGTRHWMNLSVGSSAFCISITQKRTDNTLMVEWYIRSDKGLYQKLLSHKGEIEAETGLTFLWRELPDKKASSIQVSRSADFENPDAWPGQFDWIMETALTIRRVFWKYL